MGETDAFGRPVGESSLGEMGLGAPPHEAQPRAATPQATRTPVAGVPGQAKSPRRARTRRRRAGLPIRLLIVMVVAAIGGINSLVSKDTDHPRSPAFSVPAFTSPSAVEAPTELPADSPVRPSVLQPVLRRMGRLGRMQSLNIHVDEVLADIVDPRNARKLLLVVYEGGELHRYTSEREPNKRLGTFEATTVDARVPWRVVRKALRTFNVSLAQVEFVGYEVETDGRTTWRVFIKGGRGLEADKHGRHATEF